MYNGEAMTEHEDERDLAGFPSDDEAAHDPLAAPQAPAVAVWNPTLIAVICFFTGFFPIGIFYAINFGRFGLEDRKKRELTLVVIGAIVFYLLAFTLPPSTQLAFFIANAAVSCLFYYSQERRYRLHLEAGGRRASIWIPLSLSLGWIFVLYRFGLA